MVEFENFGFYNVDADYLELYRTIKDKILIKAEKIYKAKKKKHIVRRAYCDFSCCENAMREW